MVVYNSDRLTSVRNLPSWALLAFAAGGVNVGAFLACQRFVAHVTGTLTMVGADAGQVLGLDYMLVLLCFMAGAGGSVVLVRKLGNVERGLPYWIPLTLVTVVLAAVALLGHAGAFGTFGGSVETPHDFALLCMLSFAMGMQNAAVALSTGMAVRTTHMTGPATDFAVAAATLLVGRKDERAKAWQSVALRGTKLTAFVLGAAIIVPLCRSVGFLGFVVPALACAVATVSTYAPQRIAEAMAHHRSRA
ncbi:MAG TPA: YoaK family protein [Labilithrix sp.]|nr:YoaK family protein [Labilithrix sp.]